MGKGGAATLAAAAAAVARRRRPSHGRSILLCDGDLAASAQALQALVEEVRAGRADLAVAAFATPRRRRLRLGARLRALGDPRAAAASRPTRRSPASARCAPTLLPAVVPFAPRFGMEIGMTIDAVRAGFRVSEVELPLAHRATGRTLRGFLHRGRQLLDFVAVYRVRRRPPA